MPITNRNRRGGYITASFFSDGFISINSTNGAVAANTAGETVQSMLITSIEVNAGNNTFFTVRRGANTVFVGSGSASHDFSDGRAIDNFGGCPQANVVVTKTGTGPSFILIKLHKTSAIAGGSQY